MSYYIMSDDGQLIERLDDRPTLQYVGELARSRRINLYVIEGELAGITYTHVDDHSAEIQSEEAYWQRVLGFDAWKQEKESRKGLTQ